MNEARYTMLQQEIIKNREALETLHYYLLNGFAFDSEMNPGAERTIQEACAFFVDRNAQMRKQQQETFDRMPWLANSCGRV